VDITECLLMTRSGHPCKRPGYNLYLRAVFDGARLNKLCAEDWGECFGHFTIHAGLRAATVPIATPMCALFSTSASGTKRTS
jgi:hypothetical protein